MALSYVGVGTVATAASGATSLAPALPASLAANDLMICLSTYGATSGDTTFPAGWTAGPATPNATTRCSRFAWRRFVAGDGAPTLGRSLTGGAWAGAVFAYRGVRTSGNPWDSAPQSLGNGTATTTPQGPSFTPSTTSCWVLYLLGQTSNATTKSGWTTANWGAMTEDVDLQPTQGGNIGVAHIVPPSVSASGAMSVTTSQTGQYANFSLEIIDAAAGGGGGAAKPQPYRSDPKHLATLHRRSWRRRAA